MLASGREGYWRKSVLAMLVAGCVLALLFPGQPVLPAHAAPLHQVPSNDNFAGATTIASLPYNATQNTAAATTQVNDPNLCNGAGQGSHSVWYVYTSTTAGTLYLDTLGSNYDTVLGVFTGMWGSLMTVGCDDDSGPNRTSILNVPVVSDTTYYIEVAGYYAGSSGNLELLASLVTPPANDDFDNAFVISATPYTYTQDTALATTAADDPSLSCGATGRQSHSVWYRFTASGSGRLYLDTNDSNYDTVLAVWTGSRGSLTQSACDDDSGSGLASYVDMAVTAGTTYHIEIVSYDDGTGGALTLHAIFATTKPIYLHHLASPVTIVNGTSVTEIMDRRQAWGVTATVTFDDQPAYFYLYPGLASEMALRGNIVVPLYLDGDSAQNSNVTISLADLAPDGSTVTIGSATLVVAQNASGWYVFNIPNVACTVAQGHALRLGLTTQNPSRRVTLRYDSAARNSRVELPSQDFVTVDWARMYDDAYPTGAERTAFVVDTPVYVRARASDPFGSYDVTTATLAISRTNYAINQVYDSGADHKIYEAVYTPTSVGTYLYTVTVGEGSERTITDTATGQFYASYYGVSVEPDAMLTADPNTLVDFGLAIRNIGTAIDTVEITVTASTQGWATALYLAAALIASDTDGDGAWEWVNPAYDTNGDGNPDFRLSAGATQDLILQKTVPPSVGEVVDTTRLVAISRGDTRVNDAAILTTSTMIGAQRKQLHLLESGANDTMSTQPGSANSTMTLARGESHTWVQSPPFASAFDLRQGALTVSFYGAPSGNNTIGRVTVYSGATPFGFDQHTIDSTGWQTFTIANPNVVVPAGGVLSAVIANTSSANRSFTVQYGGSGNYDARLDMPTKTYVKVEQVQTGSACYPSGSTIFNQGQAMTITVRVSDPFGSYDIAGANVRVTDPDGVVVAPGLTMNPVLTATGAITYERVYAIPITATPGIYTIVVTGTESNGVTATRSALFTVQWPATLTATLAATPGTVNVGEAITVTMVVTNNGQASALNLAPSVLITSGTGAALRASGPTPTTVLTLTAGSAASFTWVYTATGAGVVSWNGSVAGSDANSCAAVSSPIIASNVVQVQASVSLFISKQGNPDPVIAGSSLTYTVRYTNTGGGSATGVVITETYDSNVSFVSANPPPSVSNNVWNIGGLGAGGSGTILITVRVNGGATLSNVVTIGSDQTSPVTTSATTTVIALPAFNLTKSDDPDPVLVGDNLVYNITYRNTGVGNATGVVITETYDSNVSFVSASPAPDVGNNVWRIGALGAGGSGSIAVTVRVNGGATLLNQAQIGCDQGVSGGVMEQTTVVVPNQVSIGKTVSPSTVDTTGLMTFTYTLVITNTGSAVPVQQITDTLPPGFTYLTTTGVSGITRPPDSVITNGQNIAWTYTAPYPSIGGGRATVTFIAASSNGAGYCNSAGVTIGGAIGIVAGNNLACIAWPIYEIETHIAGLTIRARVRMENGRPVILLWEIR